jgi:hypothetical protein
MFFKLLEDLPSLPIILADIITPFPPEEYLFPDGLTSDR